MPRDGIIAGFATQLRENIGLTKDEVIGNIVKIVKKAGYTYVEESFEKTFSGFSKYLGSGNYLIGFNIDHYWSEYFKRFTIAHELGHLSIPEHREILEKESVHFSNGEYQSNKNIEREADLFAANFLAPANQYFEQMHCKKFASETIFYLSEYFGISQYAAVLRFIELTDMACVLIVSDRKTGKIDYEKRSKRMLQSFTHNFIHKQELSGTTLTSEWIKGHKEEKECDISLRDWYPNLPIDIPATESVLELDYNGKYLALIEPTVMDIDDYIIENTHY